MARTANVPEVSDNGKPVIHRLTCDISIAFDKHVDVWVANHDITRASAIRKFCADGFEYTSNDPDELVLVTRSTAYEEAGRKRKQSFTAVKQKASELDLLKAKLASGEISAEDLVKMLLG